MSEQDINEFCQSGGKILSFVSDGKYYAFEVKTVTDIIGLLPVTRLPKTPKFIKGVINLRGKAVPVIDFRLRLGLPETEYDARSCTIIIEVGSNQAGIICDRVSDVEDILTEQTAASPVKNGLVKCFINTKDKNISLLDPDVLVRTNR